MRPCAAVPKNDLPLLALLLLTYYEARLGGMVLSMVWPVEAVEER